MSVNATREFRLQKSRASGLLVSVRDAEEAEVALQAGVDLLDVKEPNRGALGRAESGTILEVIDVTAGRLPVSAALGELRDFTPGPIPPGLSYAKLGLAGCGHWPDWPDRWAAAMETIPLGAAPVAVAYADWQSSCCPPPEEVLEHGRRLGCRAALLDTYDKSAGDLFQHFDIAQLARWIEQARGAGLLTVVGGSLDLETFASVSELAPDYLAVRGAACRGSRRGTIDRKCVEALVRHLG